jgi:hypothetical protein
MHDAILDHILGDSNLGSSKKLLLIVLARETDPEKGIAFTPLRRLTELTGLSFSQLCTLLRQLEASGHLLIQRGAGPLRGNIYRVNEAAFFVPEGELP